MIGFALELAYALEAKAKRLNRDANEAYSQALDGGYRFDGGLIIVDEDTAWDACRITGKWCDEWADAVSELEDAWFVAEGYHK